MARCALVCVDDERTITDSLKRSLNESLQGEYLVEIAEGGEDALELFQELLEDGYEVPLIITDYIMPGMKGDELLQKVQKLSPQTVKIMLTGQATLDAVANAVNQSKLYRFISKPWEPSDLQLTVREALRSYQQTRELEELNRAYERFVPKEFLRLLGRNSITEIKLGCQVERTMSVLFADIRGFTALSETMTPQENFNFINGYFSRMEPAITQHHGFIDKYIGDAIMALFPYSADDAVCAALEMLRALDEYNETRQTPSRPELQIGIGINTGPLMLGTVGGEARLEGTVISDAVNVASRVEQMTKTYHADLLITESTFAELKNPQDYDIRILDRVTAKGKTQAVTVLEVFGADPEPMRDAKRRTLEDMEKGVKLFQNAEFIEAKACFLRVLEVHPGDKAAEVYLQQCSRVLRYTESKRSRVLVVDDNPTNVLILQKLLERHEYDVITADNGYAALKIAQTEHPDLILLDIMMPDINGYETCARLKLNPDTAAIPVIFLTALSDLDDKVKGFGVGGVDYVIKPFQAQEILARIRAHIHLQQLQRHLQTRHLDLHVNNQELKQQIEQRANAQLALLTAQVLQSPVV